MFSTPAFNVDSEKPEVERFVEAYRAKYDEDPDAAAGHAYDAMMILVQVMRNGATQPDEIKEALYKVEDFPGVTGVTTFDEKGDVLKGVFIKKIVNGTPKILQEFDYSREPETS